MSDAADVLTSRSTLTEELELDGQTITVEFREPSKGELDDLEKDLDGDAAEEDEAALIVDEFLSEPDVDASEIGYTKLLAVYSAFQRAIMNSEAIEAAREQMELDAGNL